MGIILNELIFCSKDEKIIYPHKIDNKIVFKCKCGNIEKIIDLNKPIPQIDKMENKEIIPTIEEDDEYKYVNKIASRKIVKSYLEQLSSKEYIKPFHDQKVLILTHISGADIKEILLPLGFQLKNIYIIERDKEVFEKIKNNPFFTECKKYNLDLIDFRSDIKFDLFYLDFKCNLCYNSIHILNKLLLYNAHDSSIFYLNFQMAREIRRIIDMYNQLEQKLKFEYNKEISNQMEGILKMFNSNIIDELNYLDLLKDKENLHLLRQKSIQNIVNAILNVFVNNYQSILNTLKVQNQNKPNKKFVHKFTANYEVDFVSDKEYTNRESNMVAILRYLSNSLIMLCFKQFIYINKHGTPFLSTLFMVKTEKALLHDYGFRDFIPVILHGLIPLYLRNKELIKEKAISTMIYTYLTLENAPNQVTQQSTMKDFPNELQLDIEVRAIKNEFRAIFNDLRNNKILEIDEKKYSMRLDIPYPSYFIRYPIEFQDAIKQINDFRLERKTGLLDFSPHMLSFYLVLKIFRSLEPIFHKNLKIEKCDIINVEKIDEIDEYLERNQKLNYNSEIESEIRLFRTDIKESLKGMSIYLDLFNRKGDDKRQKEIIIDKILFKQECDFILKLIYTEILNESTIQKEFGLEMQQNNEKVKVLEMSINQTNQELNPNNSHKQKMTKDEIKNIILKYLKLNPNLKCGTILEKIKADIKKEFGYEPEITECQVRAHRAWITMGKESETMANS